MISTTHKIQVTFKDGRKEVIWEAPVCTDEATALIKAFGETERRKDKQDAYAQCGVVEVAYYSPYDAGGHAFVKIEQK